MLFCFGSIIFYGQNIDDKNYDFLLHPYKYLNNKYQITIDSDTYEREIIRGEFYKSRINDYKDSLVVVMGVEFPNSPSAAKKASLRVGYSWQRLAYHTWQTPSEIENFAKTFNIYHPYRMKEFLIDEKNSNKSILDFFKNLRSIVPKTNTKDLEKLNRRELLNHALATNQSRIEDFIELKTQRSSRK